MDWRVILGFFLSWLFVTMALTGFMARNQDFDPDLKHFVKGAIVAAALLVLPWFMCRGGC